VKNQLDESVKTGNPTPLRIEENILHYPAVSASKQVTRVNQKILDLDTAAEKLDAYRKDNLTIAQAHGAFDLLHIGHVKHLQAATRVSDILIVTVTADKYINKGPGRPVYSEIQRVEMLAALEFVDHVIVSPYSDAVRVIEKLKPNFYIKGQDYQNPQEDITGKITKEREAVEAYGGQIVFTDEETDSSSKLINRHLNVYEPHVHSHLDELRSSGGEKKIIEMINSIADYKVLVIGETIIDEYHYVVPMGKSAKENMIATLYQDREVFAGGVIATANHLASFVRQVDVVTVLGEDNSFEDYIRSTLEPNISLTVSCRKGAPTVRKRRFVDPSYMRKLFEVYFMDDELMHEDIRKDFQNNIRRSIGEYDVVIVNDFGHGLLEGDTLDLIMDGAKFLAVNAQSNSANHGFNLINKYSKADFICIDGPELRLAAHDKYRPVADIIQNKLVNLIDCENFIVTQGKHGCVTWKKGGIAHSIPSVATSIVDTVGAGDAFLAVTSPLVATGGPLNLIGFVGNVVGALKANIVGHRSAIDKVSILKALTALLK